MEGEGDGGYSSFPSPFLLPSAPILSPPPPFNCCCVSSPFPPPSPYSLFRRGLSPSSISPLPYKGRIRKLDEGSPPPSLPLRSVQSCWSDIDGRDAVVLQYGVRVLCSAHNLSRFFPLHPSSFPLHCCERGERRKREERGREIIYLGRMCYCWKRRTLFSRCWCDPTNKSAEQVSAAAAASLS